jgi:hypothetical protein
MMNCHVEITANVIEKLAKVENTAQKVDFQGKKHEQKHVLLWLVTCALLRCFFEVTEQIFFIRPA